MKYLGFIIISILFIIHVLLIIYPFFLCINKQEKKAEKYFVIGVIYSAINLFLMVATLLLFTKEPEIYSDEINLYPLILWLPLSMISYITERRLVKWFDSLTKEEDRRRTLIYNRIG